MLTTMWTKRVLSLVGVLSTSSFAVADVWTVDDSGGFDFTDIQSAIAAAADGDTILVKPGTYTDFLIEDKTINVFADTTGVNVQGTVYISNLSQPKRVVLYGLTVTGRALWPTSDVALAMNVNVGAIRIDNCTFNGGLGGRHQSFCDDDTYGAGGIAADVFFCTDLAFTGCTITGGIGLGEGDKSCLDAPGGNGGDGVKTRSSQVSFYDCTLRGGRGGNIADGVGGNGGTACRVPTGGIFASGTSFTGGKGGDTDYFNETQSGDGGDGLLVGGGGNAHLLDDTFVGGAPGIVHFFGDPGEAGVGLTGAGIIDVLSGTRRKATAPKFAAPSSIISITILGQPGDQVFLPWAFRGGWRYRPAHHGTWLIPYPARMTVTPIGVIPASGSLTTKIQLTALSAGSEAELTSIQCFVIDTHGQAYLGSPMDVLRK